MTYSFDGMYRNEKRTTQSKWSQNEAKAVSHLSEAEADVRTHFTRLREPDFRSSRPIRDG